MHIALVSPSFLPSVGGLEWKIHHLASEYTRRGHVVDVFAGRDRIRIRSVPLPVTPNYAVHWCGWPLPGTGRLGLTQASFRRAILRRHRDQRFDVLHCHHLGMPTSFGLAVKSSTGVPVVATTCGGDVQVLPAIGYGDRLQPRFDRMVRDNVCRVDVIGSVSRAMRVELEKIGATARIVDIPNGVDWQRFQGGPADRLHRQLGLADRTLIVLSVGRNQPVKGYELGLRAFARVSPRFPLAVYVLIGRDMARLEPLVRELALAGRARLLEQAPADEVPLLFRSADVFFSPSLMEGFSQVNAQALACGRPCVLTDAPGNGDAGLDGGAVIARSGDVESMAEALGLLLSDEARRRTLAGEAHRAGRRYAWTRIADEYLKVFQELPSTQIPRRSP